MKNGDIDVRKLMNSFEQRCTFCGRTKKHHFNSPDKKLALAHYRRNKCSHFRIEGLDKSGKSSKSGK